MINSLGCLIIKLFRVIAAVRKGHGDDGKVREDETVFKEASTISKYKTSDIKSDMAVYSQYYLRLIQKQDSTMFAEATVAPTKPHDTRHPTHPDTGYAWHAHTKTHKMTA